MKQLMSKFMIVVALAVGMASISTPAQATTVWWDSAVSVPIYGEISMCQYFEGACGSLEIPPPADCFSFSWWDVLPQSIIQGLQYIANALGGNIHFYGGCV